MIHGRREHGWLIVAILFATLLFARSTWAQTTQTTCANVFPPGWVIVNQYWASQPCGAGYTPVKGAINTYVIEDIAHMPPNSTVLICDVGHIPTGWTPKGAPFIRQSQCAGWMMTVTKPNMTYIGN
jgi:hypothetical protein